MYLRIVYQSWEWMKGQKELNVWTTQLFEPISVLRFILKAIAFQFLRIGDDASGLDLFRRLANSKMIGKFVNYRHSELNTKPRFLTPPNQRNSTQIRP